MKTIIIKIIAGIAIISAAGIAGSLYSQVWNPEWNPFEQKLNPEVVMVEMGNKMAGVESFTYDVDFNIEATSKEGKFNMKTDVIGNTDGLNSKNPKAKTDFSLFFNSEVENVENMEEGKNVLGELDFSLSGKMMNIGKTGYFKITKMPEIPFLAMFGISLDDFTDQWIRIDEKSFEQMTGEDYEQFAEEQKQEQEKIVEKLTELLEKAKIFNVKEELPEQMIDHRMAYHYLVALNQWEFKMLIRETMTEIFTSDYFSDLPVSQEEMEESMEDICKEMDEFFEKTGEVFAEIWIGKQDKLFYRLKFEKEIDISDIDESEQGTISLKMDLNLSNFDQPMNIEAPKDFKTLKEIFESLNFPISGLLGIPAAGMTPPISDNFPTLDFPQKFPQGFPLELK